MTFESPKNTRPQTMRQVKLIIVTFSAENTLKRSLAVHGCHTLSSQGFFHLRQMVSGIARSSMLSAVAAPQPGSGGICCVTGEPSALQHPSRI